MVLLPGHGLDSPKLQANQMIEICFAIVYKIFISKNKEQTMQVKCVWGGGCFVFNMFLPPFPTSFYHQC